MTRIWNWRRKWQPNPVFLPGESCGQRGLVGCYPWGRIASDMTEATQHACIGEGNGNPLQCSCLENPRDRGAWWAVIYGVTQSWTRLKRLSSSFLMVSYSWALLIQYSLFKRITMKIWLFHSLLITTFSVILNMQTSLWGQSSAWCDISPPPSPTSCCSPPYSAPF